MCGIVGYIGKRKAWPILVEVLKRLEYRGYDSAGVAGLRTLRIWTLRRLCLATRWRRWFTATTDTFHTSNHLIHLHTLYQGWDTFQVSIATTHETHIFQYAILYLKINLRTTCPHRTITIFHRHHILFGLDIKRERSTACRFIPAGYSVPSLSFKKKLIQRLLPVSC